MYLLEIIRVAFQSILANFFRATLTMLGIIIGVAAVITMVAIGTGAQKAVNERIQALGANILNVESERRRRGGVSRFQSTMTVQDANMLLADSEHILAVVPEISEREQIKYGNKNQNSAVIGITPNFAEVRDFDIDMGRIFNEADNNAKRRVAVLGSSIPEELEVEPEQLLGNVISIRNLPFEVIGILKEKGRMGYRNPDDDVWIPLQTAQYRVFGRDTLEEMNVQVAEDVSIEMAMVEIERILRREHRIPPGYENDFEITDSRIFLNTAQETTQIFTYLLASIASISLIVGGIGIMNIMLVSVSERTKEIGIRIALGATRTNIMLQFLVESITLCILGGILGICAGFAASHVLSELAGWQTLVSPASVIIAFAFSATVGLV
ncbi:MAG: FtsX-like permease family protein, partial [Gammaproteobacteria bacterium]|nr:FtsX-like permease family protein [Gammaproteobacteria bacterium]